MPRIVTLTMNPALDASTSVERVQPEHKLRCGEPQFHPGGGGINVARVLHRLGTDVLAVHPAGGLTGQRLCELLAAERLPNVCVPIAGETRESFNVHERASGHDWRFVLPGPTLSAAESQACLDHLAALADAPRYLVASGSLPPGAPDDFYAQVASAARARGSRAVVDSSGAALAAALRAGVYLVKPSLRELRESSGLALQTLQEQRDGCARLVAQGRAEIIALSLGGAGALLVTAQEAWHAPALKVDVASTIGAGDSFLAGLLWSLDRDLPPAEALRWAMACGAAALLSAGTALSRREDVERLLPLARVEPA
jgi:6-phosphofructokinase 2